MPITEEDVRRAYYASADPPYTWWIAELQMEPPALIVADSDSGKLYRVPYRVDGDAISFEAAAEVARYSEVAAGRATGLVVVYASADESRTVTVAAWDGPPGAAVGDAGEADAESKIYDDLYPAPADEVAAAYAERRRRNTARDAAAAAGGDDELYAAVYPEPGQGRPGAVSAAYGDGWEARHEAVHAEHEHEHADYRGTVHSHPHVHRGDNRHAPGAGHGHGPTVIGPVEAGIAASRARQLAADPLGPASWSLDEVYRELYGE